MGAPKGFHKQLPNMDIGVRQENINNVPGQPVQIQLGFVPGYALTVHKTQALSIKHIVRGVLEGSRISECLVYQMPGLAKLFPCFSKLKPGIYETMSLFIPDRSICPRPYLCLNFQSCRSKEFPTSGCTSSRYY